MAIPNFLASSFDYFNRLGVTDVTTIIADFSARVLAQTPAWTDLGGNRFRSPVDADGRYFELLFTAVSATLLRMQMFTNSGTQVCDRAINIDAGGTEVRIFSGQFHFVINSVRAIPENLWGGLLDLTPDSQLAHSNVWYGGGHRNSVGSADGSGDVPMECFMNDAGSYTVSQRGSVVVRSDGGTSPKITPTGDLIGDPIDLWANFSGVQRNAGRVYQMYYVDGSIADGAELRLPIGDAASAVFKIVGFQFTTQFGGNKLAVRKSN